MLSFAAMKEHDCKTVHTAKNTVHAYSFYYCTPTYVPTVHTYTHRSSNIIQYVTCWARHTYICIHVLPNP